MTIPPEWVDPDDPDFDGYSPSVGVATTALGQAEERLEAARRVVEERLSANGEATNVIAASGRKSCGAILEDMAAAVERCRAAVAKAIVHASAAPELASAVAAATDALGEVTALLGDIEAPAQAILTPDIPPAPYVEPPLPPVQSWTAVSQQVHRDTLAWGASVRGQSEQMLILKPSPSVGKTEACIDLALQEQKAGKRVIFASRTNEVLVNETEPRFRAKSPFVPLRLHVIQGRNEDTCWNYENVKAVMDHGYMPARSVCVGCQYHDRNAHFFNVSVCPYYKTRIAANNDAKLASRKIVDPPLILTSHAGLLAAQNSGGGRLGRFWASDLILIDEDPTESMEPETVVTEEHAAYLSSQIEYKPADLMAKLLAATIDIAETERKGSESFGFKENGKPSRIHNKLQSSYAGDELHRLLHQVMAGQFGRSAGVPLSSILVGVADAMRAPKVAELVGLQTTKAVNAVLPPKCLSDLGAALHDEIATIDRIGHRVYEHVRGKPMPLGTEDRVAKEKKRSVALPEHLSYRCRLEGVPTRTMQGKPITRWRFVVQDWLDLVDHMANVVVGDAYAHVEHYRQLFKKPATKPQDPAYKDPVTVIEHVAKFPDGSLVVHWHTPAGITWLKNEGWQEHAARLETLLPRFAGQRVLIYGHLDLKPRIEKLFAAHDNFGVIEWAYEHWYGGRGKDHYRHFDAVVCISDPIPNPGGLMHKVNARAWRDVEPLRQAGDLQGQTDALTRIELDWNDMKTTFPRKMRDGRTHRRIRQEYERQGMNELAQAIHRVRGLISPKLMVIMGQQVELTRDTWAAAVTVTENGTVIEGEKVVSCDDYSFLSPEETLDFVEEVADRYGVFSTAFLHVILPTSVEKMLGVVQISFKRSCVQTFTSASSPPTSGPSHCSADPIASRPIIDRILNPPAYWNVMVQRAVHSHLWAQARSGRAESKRGANDGYAGIAERFKRTGKYRPIWAPNGSSGYTWYSNERADKALKSIKEILDACYGPQEGGRQRVDIDAAEIVRHRYLESLGGGDVVPF